MTYDQSLDWIHAQLKFGIKPGIKRMAWLLEQLGHPEKKVTGIHIVGTNGKGSTVSYLQHIYRQAGYSVGTFTSPFIIDFRERISYNGQMIAKETLVQLVERLKPLAERLPKETQLGTATEFELITAMMFLYFGEMQAVDIVLVEAGLGGRYDSTNVFSPLALLCPSIGLDHQDILGATYAEIADQKVGALHDREPFLYVADRQDVITVFEETAQKKQSKSQQFGRDFQMSKASDGTYTFKQGKTVLTGLTPGMPGQHQVRNSALALAAIHQLMEGFPVSDEAIRRGLAQTHWQGRTEFLRPNLMVDGAHNRESVAALIDVLKTENERPLSLLFAAINTKPVSDMLSALSEIGPVTVTTFEYPKAYALADYPELYAQENNWKAWVDKALGDTGETLYVITGSLYFISQVRAYILEKEENKES
ncbi:bifunctional folylpolyglutamate synthase/dihydrofolate synthase [Streptococcus sp. DD12]|uniref:bifunctional folylpolyglutamate synthase/dihydrofolate synthase n=1 Tax=Streptococcus sp. DD12 TaxID=1777880 RepID=UPI00082D120E|nr:folylpolyglutamate synthase/dihydrofolate synthase family protein [Streptococcus sp. DD12]